MTVDRGRARLKERGFQFTPLRPQEREGQALSAARFHEDEELIVFERSGQRRALVVREMAYHHLAQGTLVTEPYLVSF